MKIVEKVQGNTKLLILGDEELFYSYGTPVAARIEGSYYRSVAFYSASTTKQINRYISNMKHELRPQSFFDDLHRKFKEYSND